MAGLLAMLSAPVLLHAQAHLELVFLGSVPAFLSAWLDFVDRPCRHPVDRLVFDLPLALRGAHLDVEAAVRAVLGRD